ncbi:nickel transporter [Streptomyces sp. V3I7]|uniref:nickel transporter n=1 Tax=Streptomyces sp. V3I7 TaxID=3042278 RepID=UPI002784428F|nr:nickel transporter [Streptomyces sp. V3I7]MDQ0990038.1 nickel/cobalt exporter [Streptomyces sp. V3I7]
MKPRRLFASAAAVLTTACALVLGPTTSASAHPLGNFTVNRYDGLVAAPGRLRVNHVEDLAEIPATQARPGIERLGLAEWARRRCAAAAEGSTLTVDGRRTDLTVGDSTARLRPGQAGLDTLRVECRLTARLPEAGTVTLGFHSAGASTGPGWREITARGDRTTLTASDVPAGSRSRELTHYPTELLTSPDDTTSATVRVRAGGPALGEQRQDSPAASVLPRGVDRWTRALDDLVARHDRTLGFAALALVIATGLGALHALAPGHGKTLMAATAAARGGRARLKDVLPLAASVTVTHTLGVVALGLLVTAGSAATPSVIAWLGIASGMLVTGAGVTLVRRAWPHRSPTDAPHQHVHHAVPERQLALVGAHAGAAPPLHTHTHGGHTHTHPVAPTLRGTILLGFAGGLVPSPSAVVVLVGAAALGQAWFGLLLVVAYGAGLALTLTAAGFAVVRLGTGMTRVMERRPRWTTHPVAALVRRTTPLASACVVVALGVGLVLKGAASAFG